MEARTPQVVPVLVYEDLEAAHDYLVEAFGFAPGGVERSEDGTAVHAEVRLGDEVIWLHRVTAEHAMASPRGAGASHSGLSVHVADVDAHYERARAAGAPVEGPPVDKAYGLREYGVRDPEGHRWWFATPRH